MLLLSKVITLYINKVILNILTGDYWPQVCVGELLLLLLKFDFFVSAAYYSKQLTAQQETVMLSKRVFHVQGSSI